MCQAGGVITAATVCDHVEPHRGDERKFWAGPFQSLCAGCHNGTKQRTEHGRDVAMLDDDGWPLQSGLGGGGLKSQEDRPFGTGPTAQNETAQVFAHHRKV